MKSNSFQIFRHITGFTLVELITTIVIIGILAAVIGPRMFNNNSFSERGYVDEVAAALRYANSVAVSSGCDTSVNLRATGYDVMQRAAAGNTCVAAGGWVTPVARTDGNGTVTGNAPASVTLSPATRITFNAQGAVTGGTPPTLTVGTHSIKVDRVTGLVAVQ
jgi:MSHA pilin protein MshC